MLELVDFFGDGTKYRLNGANAAGYGLYMLCLLINTPFSPAVQKIRETLVTSQLSPSWRLDDKEAESETPFSYSLV